MRIAGLHHVALQARDVERVARFFVDVLGLNELKRHHHSDGSLRSIWVAVQPNTGDEPPAFVAIEHLPEGEAGHLGYSMLAFRIAPSARAAYHSRFVELGVTIEKETAWTLYVRDPEGNLVGLSHHPFDAPERSP